MEHFKEIEIAEYIKNMLSRAKGDDLERCEAAFKGMSKNEMNSQHGCSGYTRGEILESYRRNRRLHDTVVDIMRSGGMVK